ncbi:MAG TPA: T9SS type A sorting domain-containing protein [candidate division WOR-3 bacterium]|uniref:T9SS type A sorting domain-containing protein n=1 Tax=candidate division WOR-3 bacterium TaxID=2052148 RepID=A0A7C5E102_UNCW3|nr:T9SS type A sorting domain-containing protein [candidate division WOR-3 bacterium]
MKFTTNEPLTGVGEDLVSGLPRRFELFAPYPNPLRGEAHVKFALPRRTKVELSVYDIQGRRVKVLAHGVYEAGYHVVRFDGRDSRGRRLSQGVYFLRLMAGDYRRTRKMVLVR